MNNKASSNKMYVILNNKNGLWWRANGQGYTNNYDEAGRYGEDQANNIVNGTSGENKAILQLDPSKPPDTARLDELQKLLGQYTGKVICRWSKDRRGWRLHETSQAGAVAGVREAIDNFLANN